MTRFGSIIVILLSLGACSWFGNDDDDCSGPGCDSGGVLDNTPSQVTWYCYGSPSGTWDCQKTRDPSKIGKVNPARTGMEPAPASSSEATPPDRPGTGEPGPEPTQSAGPSAESPAGIQANLEETR